jgi:hypothetical protein
VVVDLKSGLSWRLYVDEIEGERLMELKADETVNVESFKESDDGGQAVLDVECRCDQG